MTGNTSFEHVLNNLHDQTRIIDDCMRTLDDCTAAIEGANPALAEAVRLSVARQAAPVYKEFQRTIEQFNIGIIPFVADYYNIIDRHEDQFSAHYLHNYAAHRGHYTPVLNASSSPTFNIAELADIFDDGCYEYKTFKMPNSSAYSRGSRRQTWAIYNRLSNYIATEHIYDQASLVMYEFGHIIDSIGADLPDLPELGRARKLQQQFENIKLDFRPDDEMPDYCECGCIMQVMPDSSELKCNNCGFLYELKGTVFNDSQLYSQESIRYKHAGYEPSKHVKSWLERIQARETNTITDDQIAKIEACIRRDGITNKKKLTVEQIRQYLKDCGLTDLNEHVALIKKIITGVAPPQLTYSEMQDITTSFAKAVKAYNIIRPPSKSNLLYYPFLTRKLIEMHVADRVKRSALISFIHLQGTQTLVQNDNMWERICAITQGFEYQPTDPYLYH